MADFNGDGVPDLAVSGANAITLLLGRGDGTFALPLSYLGGKESGPLVVGDFNGDGVPDLATRNEAGLIVLFNAADWGAAGAAPRGRARARTPALPLRVLAPTPGWAEISTASLVKHDPATTVQHALVGPPTHPPLPGLTATVPDQAGHPPARAALRPSSARVHEDRAVQDWNDGPVAWLDGSGMPLR